LKVIFGDDPRHASDGNEKSQLVKFLGDYFMGEGRIEETIVDDLPYDYIGSTVIPYWTGF
jgi:hypothetical protein